MAFPSDLEIEVAFNNDIDETDFAQTGWTSILPFVASFSGDLRGRDYERDTTEAGNLSVTLDNSDGRFLPGSVQSPYYPYVKSDRRFRIRGKNMVHPNVSRGGGRDRNFNGFLDPLLGVTQSSSTQAIFGFDEPVIISANAEPNAGQGKEKVHDGLKNSMWTINTQAGWIQYQFGAPIRLTRYALTIPAGNATRNPDDWAFCGSNNGTTWTPLHTVVGNVWNEDYETQEFTVTSPGSYLYYRLNITGNVGAVTNTQLAEWDVYYDEATDLPIQHQDLTHYLSVQIDAAKSINMWHELVGWFVPLEYGVRLAHSAHIWRLSGTEPTGLKYKLHMVYLDDELSVVGSTEGITDPNAEVSTLPTTTTPTQIGFSHTPPSNAKYGMVTFSVFIGATTNAGALTYGITGIQSELPTNLAPDISGYRDIFNWQIESEDTPGTVTNVTTTGTGGSIVEATSPAYVSSNATTITTASFTPANNSLLVAMVAAGNGLGTANSLGAVTDSLGGTWTRLHYDYAGFDASAEVWVRDIGTGASMTVTWNPGGSVATGLSMKVQVLTGAKPVAQQTGAVACNGGGTSFTKAITTTQPNSKIYGAFGRAQSAVDLIPNSNTTVFGSINSIVDSFGRETVSTWSTTDTLQTWTTAGGASSDYYVTNGAGRMLLTSINTSRRATLPGQWPSGEVTMQVTIPTLPLGDDLETTFMFYYQDASNYIQASIYWDHSGVPVELRFVRRLAGVVTDLGIQNLSFNPAAADLTVFMKVNWFPGDFKMKAWKITDPEPTAWSLTATDATWTTGLVGIRANLQPSWSGGTPQEVQFNDFYFVGGETAAAFKSATIGSPGSVTMGFTNTDTAGQRMAMVEILAANQASADPTTAYVQFNWTADDRNGYITIPHLIPGEWYTATVEARKYAGKPDILMSGDEGETGTLITATSFTQYTVDFIAQQPEQELRFILQSAVAGIGLDVRKLKVELGENLVLSLPASALESGVTTWARPKDIFEGWVERWPATAGQSEMTITVADRMKRLGDIELSNTLREALQQDGPQLLMPLSDSMLDTAGRFSQLGSWAEQPNGPSYVDITASRGDLGVSTYTTATDDGPTGEASFKNAPADITVNGKGYFFAIPYSLDSVGVIPLPDTTPKPKPTPPTQWGQIVSTYTKRWYATWSRSYEGDNSTRFDDSPYMYQGQFSGSPGNQKSLAGFDYNNIRATLKGAEILEAHITVRNNHARWNKGLYVFVGTHNYGVKPSTWGAANVRERRWKKWVAEGSSVTINAGTTFGNEMKNGTYAGIGIGPESDSDNYGFFYGASHSSRPYITIKYRK